MALYRATREELDRFADQREAQGLPRKVTDPVVIARLAKILGPTRKPAVEPADAA